MKNKNIICVIIVLISSIISVPNFNALTIEEFSEKSLHQNYYEKILYVGGTGPDNYTLIQDAINNASEGDFIFVYHGIYYEIVTIDKQLFINGEGRENTIIDAQKKGYTVNITANGVSISNFTIQNGSYSGNMVNYANLFVSSCNNTIKENIFRYSESGIMMISIDGNIISENIMSNNSIGLWLSGSKNIVTRNLITNNNDFGIDLSGSENEIKGNIITNNNGTGLYILDSNSNNIIGNEISNNSIGIILTWYSENELNKDNYIFKNNIRNNKKVNAVFSEHKVFSGKNTWKNNYWGKSQIFPRPIIGIKQTRFYYPSPFGALWFFIPWLRFDWKPAQQPYNISI